MSQEKDYWEARWREGRIGFHEAQANEHLRREWPLLGLTGDEAVLVPLCGKSHDLAWLAGRGHCVVGIEFSEAAVAAFFAEQGIAARRHTAGGQQLWSAGHLTIVQGDFFSLEPDLLAHCCGGTVPRAWWDRAALVALPAPERRAYAARLPALLAAGARGLLLVLEYQQAEMQGPPFAVNEPEVRELFSAPAFTNPQPLMRCEVEITPERRALGVTRLQDCLWRLACSDGLA